MSQLDGFEMLRAIRSTPWLDTTTIVVVSALDAAQIAARGGLPAGIEVLPKPVPFERLMAIAKELVNERRLERRAA
jgi:DNA-binding response OmpR family regulator